MCGTEKVVKPEIQRKSVIGSVKNVEVFFLFPGNMVVISYCILSWKVNQNYCHERQCGYKICKYFPVSVALLVRPSVRKKITSEIQNKPYPKSVSQNIGSDLTALHNFIYKNSFLIASPAF